MRPASPLLVVSPVLILLLAGFGMPTVPGRTAKERPICEIQGEGNTSLYTGEQVATTGVVTADFDGQMSGGFFIQSPGCDESDLTSDALFVYQGDSADPVALGDRVEIIGIVQEYQSRTEVEAETGGVRTLSRGHVLPDPVELNPPFDTQQGKEYLESLEGMLVSLADARVVGPTGSDRYSWVVRADLGIEHVFEDDPRGTGELLAIGHSGDYILSPGVRVGDRIAGVYGVLDEEQGLCPIQLLSVPELTSGISPPIDEDPGDSSLFTLATFNLHDLFDTLDDPATNDVVSTSAEYQRRLSKLAFAIHGSLNEPDLLAVQEAENYQVLRDLVLRPEIEREYEIVWNNTPDLRGLDTALLYAPEQFVLLDHQTYQACTNLVDGLGPDGNQDVVHPQNAHTCDGDGDGELDGNRLFSRPVLAVHLVHVEDQPEGAPLELVVLVNHWKSKTEDTGDTPFTLPRRVAQAEFVAGLVNHMKQQHPGALLIVTGDLNDFPASEPLTVLGGAGLRNLTAYVDRQQRYSYIYRGISQVLDYILIAPPADINASQTIFFHINSDYPFSLASAAGTEYRSSDHDPFLARFVRYSSFAYLPLIRLGY